MLHCFTCTFMVCKLEFSCKYNYSNIFALFFLDLLVDLCICYFWVYTRLAILAIVCPVLCTNCYKKK